MRGLQAVLIHAHVERRANQPRQDRIEVEADADGGKSTDQYAQGAEILQPRQGQRPHRREVLQEFLVAASVPAEQDRLQKLAIRGLALAIATLSQQERLFDRPLEPVMGFFNIAILVAPSGGVCVGPDP